MTTPPLPLDFLSRPFAVVHIHATVLPNTVRLPREIIPGPPQLLLADMEGARQRVIESASHAHPLFRREAAGRPKVSEMNGVQRDKVNPVLIPGIGGLAEMFLIGISHIEIPVMLSGDVFDLGFQGRK